MNRRAYYERMFKIGGIWNTLAAAIFIALAGPAFSPLEMPAPTYSVFFNGFFMAVLLFGVGYYMVGLDPTRNRVVVVLGALGKIGVVVLFVWAWLSGEFPGVLAIVASVDLAFAMLFFEVLYSQRGQHPELGPA
jgi:hypothetical protein